MENSLDLVIVWATCGSCMCRTFWPMPIIHPPQDTDTVEGLPIRWPKRAHPGALSEAGQERTPWLTRWGIFVADPAVRDESDLLPVTQTLGSAGLCGGSKGSRSGSTGVPPPLGGCRGSVAIVCHCIRRQNRKALFPVRATRLPVKTQPPTGFQVSTTHEAGQCGIPKSAIGSVSHPSCARSSRTFGAS